MKNTLLAIILLLGIKSFSQNHIEYFGGAYDSVIYFNWVSYNEDSCSFIIELSEDSGETYMKVGEKYYAGVHIPVLRGIKILTCSPNALVRLTYISTEGKIFYQPQLFKEGVYNRSRTYVSRVIRAKF